MKLAWFCVCILITSSVHGYKSYSDYQVWQTESLTRDQLSGLIHKVLNNGWFEAWTDPVIGREAYIMTSSSHVSELRDKLTSLGLKSQLYIEDVETLIEREIIELNYFRILENETVTFEHYMELSEIESYLEWLVASYPEIASIQVIGHSFEGRPLQVLKLSCNNGEVANSDESRKPAVFMDACIHAREWLAPPVALYAAHRLTMAADDKDSRALLELADWYIMPVANPDGYVYSWEEDRFWRKNRRTLTNSNCTGVDLNRNFDIKWEDGPQVDTCHSWYKGASANSEPETLAIAEFLFNLTGQLALYNALHSYSTLLLRPYGYSTAEPSKEILNAAEAAISAVEKVRGTKYQSGNIPELLYFAYGTSQDFAYDVIGAPFAYTWELPAGGNRHYDAPASDILPVVQETWEGIKTLARIAAEHFYATENTTVTVKSDTD